MQAQHEPTVEKHVLLYRDDPEASIRNFVRVLAAGLTDPYGPNTQTFALTPVAPPPLPVGLQVVDE